MDGLFDFLHEDIKITILSCLPQKSLLKLRSVSKSWRHIIDASSFREVHNNSRRKHVDDLAFVGLIRSAGMIRFAGSFCGSWKLLMRLADSHKSCYYDFPYHDIFLDSVDDRLLSLCGPVHGLICLYREYSIALCNPSLGKIKILPPSKKDMYDHMNLNPSRCSYQNVGFRYDNDKKDYKVVQIWLNGSEGRTVVEVYSRRENKWRVLADHPPLHLFIIRSICRLWPWISARMVYWYGLTWGMEEDHTELDPVILSFDMHSEAFKMIEIPFIEYSRKTSTVVKEDSILLFTFVIQPPLDVDIWEYKRDWVKLVCLRQFDQVRSWINDGLVFKISSDGQLVLYEFFSKKEIKRIDLVPKLGKDQYERSKIEYMGSFVSP